MIRSEGSRIVVEDGKGEPLAASISTAEPSAKEYAAEVNRRLESVYVAGLLREPAPVEGSEPLDIELAWNAGRSRYDLLVSPGEGNLAVFLVDPEGGMSVACPSPLGDEPPQRGDWIVCGSHEARPPKGQHHVIALRIDQPWLPLLEEAAGRQLGRAPRFAPSRAGRGSEAAGIARAIRERLRGGDAWRRGAVSYDTLGADR